MTWCYIKKYVFMVWCLVTHRGNFTTATATAATTTTVIIVTGKMIGESGEVALCLSTSL
jgi:hypothetical protein